MNRKVKKFWMLFLVCLFSMSVKSTVLAKEQCKVVFANAKGIVSNETYKSWEQTVEKGSTIVLPKHSIPGYTNYWVLKTASGEKKYNPGAKYTVTGNVKFYHYLYKQCTVKFYTNTGDKCYTVYTKKVLKGAYTVMPPVISKYVGWSTVKQQTIAKFQANEKVKITKDTNFYVALKSKPRTVGLYWADGKLYKKLTLYDGYKDEFPSVISKNGGMILGWSTEKGQKRNPKYIAGTRIPESGNKFYMVEFLPTDEPNVTAAKMLSPKKYKHVFIVGDSRSTLAEACFGKEVKNVSFVAKYGKGYDWFTGKDGSIPSGSYSLVQELLKVRGEKKTGKMAIVFNLGVNDLGKSAFYAEYYNQIAGYLKTLDCDLYFMSVNPVNEAMITKARGEASYRTEKKVTKFNQVMKANLNPKYFSYIDTCTPLRTQGWISAVRTDGISDGVHYSSNTYRRIYNYMIKTIEARY